MRRTEDLREENCVPPRPLPLPAAEVSEGAA